MSPPKFNKFFVFHRSLVKCLRRSVL